MGAEPAAQVSVAAGTSRDIITRLNSEIVRLLHAPDMKENQAAVGPDVVAGSPEQFAAYMKAETEQYGKLVRTAGIRAD